MLMCTLRDADVRHLRVEFHQSDLRALAAAERRARQARRPGRPRMLIGTLLIALGTALVGLGERLNATVSLSTDLA